MKNCKVTAWLLRSLRYVLLPIFLLFVTFEIFPGLLDRIHLGKIRYYSIKSRYKPDSSLVFVPRKVENTKSYEFNGDLYVPELGDALKIQYLASYNSWGFRSNSSQSPFEVLVIGDSYIEFGEADDLTLSEQLRSISGRTTFNLGRGWYGPYQYNELLKRYGVGLKPRYAIFCFFNGNDLKDINEYEQYLSGGDYYHFALDDFWGIRLFKACSDTYAYFCSIIPIKFPQLKTMVKQPQAQVPSSINNLNDLGVTHLNGQNIAIRFAYKNSFLPTAELVRTKEWQQLFSLLAEFRDLCLEHEIKPIVLFIPTKLQIYAKYLNLSSNGTTIPPEVIAAQLRFNNNTQAAMRNISMELHMPLIDLLPFFASLAEQGHLLYYPFDTHWNPEGRHAAASYISKTLSQIEKNHNDIRALRNTVFLIP